MARAVSFTQAGGSFTLRNAHAVIESSSYDNENDRNTIILEVDEFTTEMAKGWEAHIDSTKLVSAIPQFGLCCKIQTDNVRVWTDSEPGALPLGIHNRHAHTVVQLNGAWHTTTIRTPVAAHRP